MLTRSSIASRGARKGECHVQRELPDIRPRAEGRWTSEVPNGVEMPHRIVPPPHQGGKVQRDVACSVRRLEGRRVPTGDELKHFLPRPSPRRNVQRKLPVVVLRLKGRLVPGYQ
jgi:hypothetical protein